MGQPGKPRDGSMGVWPRKRARRSFARIRHWAPQKDVKPLGFAGYKVGMTHVMVIDNKSTSQTKGQDIFMPVTVIECPNLKVFGINAYHHTPQGFSLSSTILHSQNDKHLARKICIPKKFNNKIEDLQNPSDIRLLVHTQPVKTSIGKKKPEIFELPLGGKDVTAKIEYAKNILGKDIYVKDIFCAGNQIDIHAVTKGKGLQGPVRRFGISLKQHKSEKGVRAPGSLGGWRAQGHTMYRVAHAGQMGYHQRVDFNKLILQLNDKPEEINQKGGFVSYGNVQNPYLLVKGSIPGSKKRLIRFTHAIRPIMNMPKEAPLITMIQKETNQGKARNPE